MSPNFKTANHWQLTEIVFYDKDCPKALKEEAQAELRKRNAKRQNIKYVEKGGNRG
jgi:hypothetical protein